MWKKETKDRIIGIKIIHPAFDIAKRSANVKFIFKFICIYIFIFFQDSYN